MSNGIEISFLKPGSICYVRESYSETRRTAFDLYSVYDQDTLVCVDAKEPLLVASKWYKERYEKEPGGDQFSLYEDYRSSSLVCFLSKDKGMTIQVMGTSFTEDRNAYLPEMPSSSLNQKLENLLEMKARGYEYGLMFVICRNDAESFSANADKDPYFAKLLASVYTADIPIDCLRCTVDEDGMRPDKLIPLRIPGLVD